MKALAALLLLVCVVPANAVTAVVPKAKHRKVKKVHQPTWFEVRAFPPTPESLYQQNEAIDKLGLPRIKDSKALVVLISSNQLVPVTANKYVRISPKLEADRRYAKPFVDDFLQELGKEYYERFEDSLQVNSAVRTEKTQMRLLRWNHNAAPVHGEKASAHLAGVAVDLQRRGLTQAQIEFIQQRLQFYVTMGMIIVEEELKQPCFHIVVTGNYAWLPPLPLNTKPPDFLFLEMPNGDQTKPRLDGSGTPDSPR
jgi:Family of unknown function (DUF5715)